MTESISLSNFASHDDRTLLVGCDFDDSYWLHIYFLNGEIHFLNYSNVEGEISILSDEVVESAPAESFHTWENFSETLDIELIHLLEDRLERFSINESGEYQFEADDDGFYGPIASELD